MGKSSLILRYVDDTFASEFMVTIGVDFKIKRVLYPDAIAKKDMKIKLQIWDVAGPERFRTITSAYYRGAQGILLCFSIDDRESFTNAITLWIGEVNKYNPLATVLLLGLKGDLLEQRQVSVEEAQQAANDLGARYCECSSKTRHGIDELFSVLLHSIMSDESAKANIVNDSLARARNMKTTVGAKDTTDKRKQYGKECVVS